MNTKYIFVTGGVVSGLGKGITAASLGRLLKNRGYKVINQKFDPYINVDPGTMNPSEHGEVFVTEDGAETDLDLGHYERFIDENLNKFKKTEREAFKNTMMEFGFDYDERYHFSIYKEINTAIWKELEEGGGDPWQS